MFWVQYEAKQNLNPQHLEGSIGRIAELIAPYPVAAFDAGRFGIGLLVSDPEFSEDDSRPSPGYDPSGESFTYLPGSVIHAEADSQNTSINERGKGRDNVPATTPLGHVYGGTTDGTFPNTGLNTGGNQLDSYAEGNGNGNNGTGVNRSSNEGQNKNEDKEDPQKGHLDSHPKPDNTSKPKNDRFTGTAVLCVGASLKQELTISFGLRISPSLGSGFADCLVTLNPVIVRSSTLFRDDETIPLDAASSNHFYVTEQASITLGAYQGYCEPPVSVHPLQQHFAERQTTSKKRQYDVAFEASATPKFCMNASHGTSSTVEYDPVTLALEPLFIGTGARNDFQWRYRPSGPHGTNLELSAENPPVHKATFRIYDSNTPRSIKVATQAIFGHHGRLGRQKSSPFTAAARILRDLHAMHILINLEVNVENKEQDWFLFPSPRKEGCRLQSELSFQGEKLGMGKPEKAKSMGVSSALNYTIS